MRMLWVWSLAATLLASVGSVSADGEHVTVALEADSAMHVGTEPRVAEIHSTQASGNTTSSEILVVGVNTNVLKGAAARETIRQTWARADLTRCLGVRVWFVGCQPDLSALTQPEQARAKESIELEKATYRDLLTEELRCSDSPGGRVAKTVEFMHFIESTTLPRAPKFLLMTEEDVYVRLDGLVSLLDSGDLPSDGLYAGSEGQREPSPTDRDPESPLFLSFDAYPMSELPPYVDRAHYIVSHDIVEFISSNRDDLVGFSGLDDITMALWMLALQVHPVFLDSFQVLRGEQCSGELLSVARISQNGLHQIHTNVLDGAPFCKNFSRDGWTRLAQHSASSTVPSNHDPPPFVKFYWDLQHDPVSSSLHIQVDVSVGNRRETLVYVPSAGPYAQVFCPRLLDLLHVKFAISKGLQFCAHHRHLLQAFLANPSNDLLSLRAKTEIVRHNLARDEIDEISGTSSPVITVALSPAGAYSRVLIECLFVSTYNDHHIVVLNEADLLPHSPPPDLFVFSILDDGRSFLQAIEGSARLPTGTFFVSKYGPTSQLVMVSGEAWPPHKLDARVTLLSTVSSPQHTKHVYIPFVSSIFGEMVRHYPSQLLAPAAPHYDDSSQRRFCAYLYANCERSTREYMFDLLNTIEPVDALGICQGSRREPDESRRASRQSNFYSDDAVDMYRQYKFVIAFENTATVPGYLTEKIVTAFLAGSVPIFHGHSATVRKLFNPKAFIDCGRFESLRECADEVQRIHFSPSDYHAMRLEAPVVNHSAFIEAFSWHPSIVSDLEIREGSTDITLASNQVKAHMLTQR